MAAEEKWTEVFGAYQKIEGATVMHLQKIHIKNYRLLKDVEICLDSTLTLIVGKNNTGKTSIANLIRKVLDGEKTLVIDDYPLDCRSQLYETMEEYWSGAIGREDIKKRLAETKVSFYVDYSEEDEDQSLGGLRPFIIDVDDQCTVAQIDAVYEFVEAKAEELFTKCKERYEQLLQTRQKNDPTLKENDRYDRAITATVARESFSMLFSLKILAVNPNDATDYQAKTPADLNGLFIYRTIEAERNLDESEEKNRHPLSEMMNRVFNSAEEDVSESLGPIISELNRFIYDANFTAQERINTLMDKIISNMVYFGYPSAEDLKLKANSNISLKQQILSNTDLTYTSADESESLPSTHNGLGYKNLIKISLILSEFSKVVHENPASIPLLFIEEPEAHMHPQLQTTFVEFLNRFLEESIGCDRYVQTILSSHSPHIANTVDFKQVRYMRRMTSGVICKDLQDFCRRGQADEQEENRAFVQKYMKLSYCDLYFCDKAILVEGASERLLIPKMITKCAESGLFDKAVPPLQSQYYVTIEVGGAYAHRFYDFLDYLEIPTLILTDVDFVKEHNKKCQKANATHSSNGAIIRWCHDAYDIPVSKSIPIEKVIELSKDSDKRTNALRHLEYQKEEKGAYPRSLEEAIENVNRNLFGIAEEATEIPLFDEDESGESKTDFAIKLLTDSKFEDFIVPSYIRDGLAWLNDQAKIPTKETPVRKHKRLRRGE